MPTASSPWRTRRRPSSTQASPHPTYRWRLRLPKYVVSEETGDGEVTACVLISDHDYAPLMQIRGSEAMFTAINDCIQILGGMGFSAGGTYPFERLLRDSRILLIFEGAAVDIRASPARAHALAPCVIERVAIATPTADTQAPTRSSACTLRSRRCKDQGQNSRRSRRARCSLVPEQSRQCESSPRIGLPPGLVSYSGPL